MMSRFAHIFFRLLAVTAVGCALWWSGRTPLTVARALGDWRNRPRVVATEQWVEAFLVGAVWFIMFVLGNLLTWRLAATAVRASRRLANGAREQSPQTFLGVFLSFFVGSYGSAAHALSSEVSVTERLHGESRTGDSELAPASRASTQSNRYVLPALASAGLALGVTKHIQRERALLLRDAPSSARLRRPDATSLATGVALFERANIGSPDIEQISSSDANAVVVPLGMDADRLVSLTIKPGEVVSIDAPADDGLTVLRHILNTVALAPWLRHQTVVACGFECDEVITDSRVIAVGLPSEARQLALRARSTNSASPVVVVARLHFTELDDLPSHGVMVVSASWASSQNVTRIIREQNHWRVSTTNETFLPYGVSRHDALSIRAAMKSMATLDSTPEPATVRSSREFATHGEFVVPLGSLIIRVLGPVQVFSTCDEVKFRKAKSLELLCWLAFHRDCPTVSGARTALWEIDVKDSTFHNVLSELRHGLGASGFPDGAGRMSKHRLFLDPRIVTDAEDLRDVLVAAESGQGGSSIRALQQSLHRVRGLPFSSVGYAWADAEGITSTLVWRVTRAVECVARVATAAGDRTALLDAIAAGLRMSPGDEQFLALQESSAA